MKQLYIGPSGPLFSPSLESKEKTTLKKNSYIFSQKVFLMFREMELFQLEKWKKYYFSFSKKLIIFREMELSGPKMKKVLIFSLKKAFLIFQEMEFFKKFPSSKNWKNPLQKHFLYFTKWNFLAPSLINSYFLKSFSYISGRNLQKMKNKNF